MDNAKNLNVMIPMYNLLENSDNYSKTNLNVMIPMYNLLENSDNYSKVSETL